MASETVTKKILFARYLFESAKENINSNNTTKKSAGILLLHDSIEIFLIAVAEHTETVITPDYGLAKIIEEIEKKLPEPEKAMPPKTMILRLNRQRVNIKHHGLTINPEDTNHFLISTLDFIEELCSSVIGSSFYSVSLVQLLSDGEIKEILAETESCYGLGEYYDCLISCRKVIFLLFEQEYSIYGFKDNKRPKLEQLLQGSRSPNYATNPEYIEKHVGDPTEYICLDHNDLGRRLLEYGIVPVDFWNIWRLTPPVFRNKKEDVWVVANHFIKLYPDNPDNLKVNAEYCLHRTIEIAMQVEKHKGSSIYSEHSWFTVKLKSDKVTVYKKADKSSEPIGTTPAGVTEINCNYTVKGLNDNDDYWDVSHYDPPGPFLHGYIHSDDILPDSLKRVGG